MPANKNALIRYKTIDNCLRNRYRRWTLDDLVEACSDALYECEGITKGVSVRTVQSDLQIMRSEKLGYNAPIEVYDHKYYRYAGEDYSINDMPLSQNDLDVMQEAVDMLRQLQDFSRFSEIADMVNRLQDKLAITRSGRKPIVHFDTVSRLRGIEHLTPLYEHILHRQPLIVSYHSFKYRRPKKFIIHPYLLKEYRNRWFLFGCREPDMTLFNLALDRIVSYSPASDIVYRESEKFDSEHFFDDVIGVSKNIDDVPQAIHFTAVPRQANYIDTKPIHPSQRCLGRDRRTGNSLYEIRVVVNPEMYAMFLSFGPGLWITSPEPVVARMSQLLHIAASNYPAPG